MVAVLFYGKIAYTGDIDGAKVMLDDHSVCTLNDCTGSQAHDHDHGSSDLSIADRILWGAAISAGIWLFGEFFITLAGMGG